MGKKTDTNEEKLPLMEFLYKDTELISSLYSQIFGGDLLGVSQLASTSEESTLDGRLNLAIANTNTSCKDTITEELVKNIASKDDKIIDLFSELNIKECTKSLNNYHSGKIIQLEGKLYFRNLDTLKNIMPIVKQLGIIPTNIFSENYNPKTTDLLIDIISNTLPHGLEFEIITKQFEKVICGVNEKFLLNDINQISKNYASKYIGTWSIIGILDNILPPSSYYKYSDKDYMKKAIDEIESYTLKILYPNQCNKFLITPIIIYRNLTY